MVQIIKPISLKDQMCYSTVMIQTDNGQGTGFIFIKNYDDLSVPISMLITNKHVVNDSTQVRLLFHEADNDGNPTENLIDLPISISTEHPLWRMHPDKNIDLCALDMNFINVLVFQNLNKRLYFKGIPEEMIPKSQDMEEFSCGDKVVMVGYPLGIWDATNNFPIFRQGITATNPIIDFNGKKEFVVDIACFPGSSGSPIFAINDGIKRLKTGSVSVGIKDYFLGVLYAGPYMNTTGKIEIREIPTKQELCCEIHNMIHLGYIIKASEIIALADVFRNTYIKKQNN